MKFSEFLRISIASLVNQNNYPYVVAICWLAVGEVIIGLVLGDSVTGLVACLAWYLSSQGLVLLLESRWIKSFVH
jgi:hypothetical protein